MNKTTIIAVLMTVLLLTAGCSTPNQYFNEAVLDECSTHQGELKSGDISVEFSVAPIGSDVQNVTFRAKEDQKILAACVIPYDSALDNMPASVSEALTVCENPENGLLLNVNATTGAVVWPARSCELYSLYVNVQVPGLIDSTEQVISHFTLDNGRLVPVNARQIMAWYRGRPVSDDSVAPSRPTRRSRNTVVSETNLDEPTPPPSPVEERPTAAAPDRSLPAAARREEIPAPPPSAPRTASPELDESGGA